MLRCCNSYVSRCVSTARFISNYCEVQNDFVKKTGRFLSSTRVYSTTKVNDDKSIRNIGIIAHIDAVRTT